MHHEHLGLHLNGKINRPLGISQPLFVLAAIGQRRFEQIRSRLGNTRRQWAEIMNRTDLNNTLFDCADITRNQKNAYAVTEFCMRKT